MISWEVAGFFFFQNAVRAATIQGLKDYSFSITRAPYALHDDDFAVQYRTGTVIDTSDGYAFGIRGR